MAGPGGKTVACEQTLLPIWHAITAVQVRTTITATAHISADLYGHELDDVASAPDAVDECSRGMTTARGEALRTRFRW
jgi:hypothetical protein